MYEIRVGMRWIFPLLLRRYRCSDPRSLQHYSLGKNGPLVRWNRAFDRVLYRRPRSFEQITHQCLASANTSRGGSQGLNSGFGISICLDSIWQSSKEMFQAIQNIERDIRTALSSCIPRLLLRMSPRTPGGCLDICLKWCRSSAQLSQKNGWTGWCSTPRWSWCRVHGPWPSIPHASQHLVTSHSPEAQNRWQ
jgi:hypothetical protein